MGATPLVYTIQSSDFQIALSLLTSGNFCGGKFCGLLITFANSLDPDHDRQNIGPDLDPNCLAI